MNIKTWAERIRDMPAKDAVAGGTIKRAMQAEIDELRTSLTHEWQRGFNSGRASVVIERWLSRQLG